MVGLAADQGTGEGPDGHPTLPVVALGGESLQLGPVGLRLDLPALRAVSWGGSELVHAVVMAVRDRNWGTVPARLTVLERQASGTAVNIRLACVHESDEVGFSWEGTVRLQATSGLACTVTYDMLGRATRDFLGNRIGFCVLHPLSVTGQSVSLRSPALTTESRFPVEVAPWQPFLDLIGMAYAVDGARVDIAFEGELFETEDQRNWTDASFKTYCPPLRRPYPRWFRAGQEVSQKVVLELTGAPTPTGTKRRSGPIEVRLGTVGGTVLPQIGTGLGKGHHRDDVKRVGPPLSRLGPAYLHLAVEPAQPDWESYLWDGAGAASDAGASLQLEVVADDADSLDAVADALSRCAKASQGKIGRVMLFDSRSSVTTRPLAAAWQSVARRHGLPELVYGGSRANFAELNRSSPPLDLLSGLTFALNPQVHAFGDDEIVETLLVHEVVARQASAMAPALPLHVGPVTLQPRFNAVVTEGGTQTEPPPDPRLSSLWAAAWTLGSVAALAQGGARELTFFEALGPRGIVSVGPARQPSRPTVYPVFAVLCQLCGHCGDTILGAPPVQAGVLAVLGLAKGADLAVFVANLGPVTQVVQLEDVGASFTRMSLDIAATERTGQETWEHWTGRAVRSEPVELRPHEVTVFSGPSGRI